ncbi:MAG TPA: S-adenosylmethionine:tRNA ribosyltransferase-isomerase [Planctomycetota bacterium]|nr:S-adenosylmethionine:tRNA ribosyltransferase-isomerase [Planctomycetota bacterium]
MSPATAPRHGTIRLLHLAADDTLTEGTLADLPQLLRPGDLLVCNDAATLPASLRAVTGRGEAVELRLCGQTGEHDHLAVVFGAGDWRDRTEDRAPPPRLRIGDQLSVGDLRATIVATDAVAPRLVTLQFDRAGAALWRALYAAGRPVQYSYLDRPLDLWDVQTVFAARPWAVEPPSAGLALTWELLLELRRAGVAFARVTHAAGISSTGDAALDARLPLAERYDVPAATVAAIAEARRRGSRVLAVGTTVVRALESAARRGGGTVIAGTATTDLRLSETTPLLVVDGILTGMHEADTSHFALLGAFVRRERLHALAARATELGFLAHEFGDVALILAAPSTNVCRRRTHVVACSPP